MKMHVWFIWCEEIMSLNDTPLSERIHIGIFGKRNAGKSSIFNAITGQEMAVVSDRPGTTTDPVCKAMELLPIGPVVFIDTAGFDDDGELGSLRVEKTRQALRKIDVAILVVSAEEIISSLDRDFIKELIERNVPYIICINKCDLCDNKNRADIINAIGLDTFDKEYNAVFVSARDKQSINELKNKIIEIAPKEKEKHIISDLVGNGEVAILVVPIDESAPKGRLILPQQQVIRDLLDGGAIAIVTKDSELEETLKKLKDEPKVVITDSQAFAYVSKIVPDSIYLTSFSILMARYKGDLSWQVEGAKALDNLKNGSRILISEGCSHHRQCGDIGTVKLPAWIKKYTGKDVNMEFTSGTQFPEDVSCYDLIIHCGGCMLNEQEMKYRIGKAKENGVPITNYGVAIAYMNGILKRSLSLLTIEGK